MSIVSGGKKQQGGNTMPQELNIWYCTDNCGPGNKYRKRCNLHHGIALEHVGLDRFLDGRHKIVYNGYCQAAAGYRKNTLKAERVDEHGDEIN